MTDPMKPCRVCCEESCTCTVPELPDGYREEEDGSLWCGNLCIAWISVVDGEELLMRSRHGQVREHWLLKKHS